jgi:hypothetical protein
MNVPFKFGRNRPAIPATRAPIWGALMATLPTPPDGTINDGAKALPCLEQMFLNDTLGDCTAACAFHVDGVLIDDAAAPGGRVTFTDAEVEAFYSATSGYVPGDPSTDNGADEVTVLNYWQSKGLFSGEHKISAWTPFDATDKTEAMTAIWLFENAVGCIELPDEYVAMMDTMKNGFVWREAGPPNPNNGHCFAIVGYDVGGVIVSTWGMWGAMTWAAFAKYCVPSAGGAAYTVLAEDALITATGKTPGGYDFSQLSGYLPAVGAS